MLFVGWSFVVRRSLFVVRCSLCVVLCSSFVVKCCYVFGGVCCRLFNEPGLLCFVRW